MAVLVLPSGVEILQLWIDRNGPLHRLQQFIGGVDVGVGQPKPQIWAWVVTEVSLPALPNTAQETCRAALPGAVAS